MPRLRKGSAEAKEWGRRMREIKQRKRGGGFWDSALKVIDNIGRKSGDAVSSAMGKEFGVPFVPNPYELGYTLGHDHIAPALKRAGAGVKKSKKSKK